MNKVVSIIIPTYNEEKNIAILLEQLAKVQADSQSPFDIEIILVDGGSTDATTQICSEFPVQILHGSPGRGNQMNIGAHGAKGDALLFLHADSQFEFLDIQEILHSIDRGRPWGCCTMRFDENTSFFKMVAWGSHKRAQIFGTCYGDQGIFCTRKLFLEVGGYLDVPIMEDVLISHRLKSYYRPVILPTVVITSTRRFKQGGPLRVLFKMQVLKLLFTLGLPLKIISQIYNQGGREKK